MESSKKDVVYTSIIGILVIAFVVVGCFYYLERSSRTEDPEASLEEMPLEEESPKIEHSHMDIDVVDDEDHEEEITES